MTKVSRAAAIVFTLIFLIDITFIILHFAFGWSVINLDEEGNLTAWYSSTKLLGLAVLCAWLWNVERKQAGRKLSFLWLVVALIFLGLSMDETASLHERLARAVMEESSVGLDIRETVLQGDATRDSFAWVLILSPFILATVLFFAFFFYSRLFRSRAGYVPALLGLLMFILAVVLEATIYLAPSMKDWEDKDVARYQENIKVEEAGEMLGSTLFLLAFWRYKKRLEESAGASQ
ncbi:MAG: hypothetical protein JXB04_00515 [Kiritimatiellae bacterium]|nr:hypothetical protein [Kiritimatiellia bacterium]